MEDSNKEQQSRWRQDGAAGQARQTQQLKMKVGNRQQNKIKKERELEDQRRAMRRWLLGQQLRMDSGDQPNKGG